MLHVFTCSSDQCRAYVHLPSIVLFLFSDSKYYNLKHYNRDESNSYEIVENPEPVYQEIV